MARKINYFSRNFVDTRTELINFVRQYYPDILNDFNDSSVGMMMIELNAAIADVLSFHTDRMFQETQIDYAQERKSVMSMARTFGLKVPGKRPSITIVDFTVTVPVDGDSFDLSYAPILRRGAQISGGGKVFEVLDDIDFASPFTIGGIPNRVILPIVNGNNTITGYNLIKREIVINGTTKIFRRIITPQDIVPFFEIVLPDNDVLSIESIITLEGTNYTTDPSVDKFFVEDRWYEVPALVENKIFVEDTTKISDNSGISVGKWLEVNKRFITEYTDNGFTKIIFGSGTQDVSSLCDFDDNPALINKMGDFINNMALGTTPKANETMFIRYRVGGGANSNVGSNTITNVNLVDMFVNGPDNTINNAVKGSLKVNNPVPAMGGRDEPSIEEIRNLVRYNFSSQNRAVTLKDYQARISLMGGQFGVPFRCGVLENQNKVSISVLGLNPSGKLTGAATDALKSNIADYLSEYRMINDYIEVNSGRVINLSFEIDLFVDKQYPTSSIISTTISKVKDYFDINKHYMGENIYLAPLIEIINNVNGVLNVVDIRVYNNVGGQYSPNEISQPYLDENTKQIDLLGEFTIFGEPTGMHEIKFPDKDIRVRVK